MTPSVALIRRSALIAAGLWVLTRVLFVAVAGVVALIPFVSVLLVLVVVGLSLIDLAIMRERLFLANLGLSRRRVAGLAFVVAGALELIASVALRAAA